MRQDFSKPAGPWHLMRAKGFAHGAPKVHAVTFPTSRRPVSACGFPATDWLRITGGADREAMIDCKACRRALGLEVAS